MKTKINQVSNSQISLENNDFYNIYDLNNFIGSCTLTKD